MDIDEEATTSWAHFVAGAVAGTVEHVGMFPIDTIKARSPSPPLLLFLAQMNE